MPGAGLAPSACTTSPAGPRRPRGTLPGRALADSAEAGGGKSSLARAFLSAVQARGAAACVVGHCAEHVGAGEPYLPLLEVLGELGRRPDRGELPALLRRHAPTWLLHLPALLHALCREAILGRMGPLRRVQYHHRIALRLERGFGDRADELALELALHFEHGRDARRSVHYLRSAARSHARRCANREALDSLGRALALTPQLPALERTALGLSLREQRALLHRSTGDLPASLAEFAALAGAATAAGERSAASRALLYAADQVAWFDTPRCLEMLTEALALSDSAGDEGLRVQVRGHLGFIRATRLRWTDEDAEACLAAAAAARRAEQDALAWSSRAGHVLILSGRYEEAVAVARAGLPRALAAGDVAEYLTLHFNWGGALFFLGDIGESLDVQLRAIEVAQRNDPALWAAMLRNCRAMTYEEACFFSRSRDLAEGTLAFAQEEPVARRMLMQRSQLTLAMAYRGLGEPERALAHLRALPEEDCQDLDIVLTRGQALAECWWALGELGRAERQAQQNLAALRAPGERSMLALAHRLLARVALAQGRRAAAEAEIAEAQARLEGGRSVANWRVLATAAEVHRAGGRSAEAYACFRRSAVVLREMASGLAGHRDAQEALLGCEEVRAILAEAAPASEATAATLPRGG